MTFKAVYINLDDNNRIVRIFSFDDQFLNSIKDCYIHAMKVAMNMCNGNEFLSCLEYISC